MDARPIGIFDSGLGGLTAAKTLEHILPGENLIYFGDSANAPYGTRSLPELTALAQANAEFLLHFKVKAILVACGTVSSNVLGLLEQKYPVPFFGVVEAACRRAAELSKSGRIAVAATEATIASGAYVRRLHELNPQLQVFPKACQSLVATVEQGHFLPGDSVARTAVERELAPIKAENPDTLVLACTHFPLLSEHIAAYLGPEVRLLSVAEETAIALKNYLIRQGLCSQNKNGQRRWFTSGSIETFANYAEVFLGHKIQPEQHIHYHIG